MLAMPRTALTADYLQDAMHRSVNGVLSCIINDDDNYASMNK